MEYAYTITGDNPVFKGRFAGTYLLGWNMPVTRVRLRLLVPPDRPLARSLSGQAAVPAPVEREAGACREWLWDLTNTVPVQAESTLPIWFKPLPQVEFSEYNSWADVARWAVAQYVMTGTTERVLGPQLDTQVPINWALFMTTCVADRHLPVRKRLRTSRLRKLLGGTGYRHDEVPKICSLPRS